ncbi:PREDICTED: zinc finger protein 664-like [Cyprinodon variegatus]|uniref:zinc finger protein 664-like n=1 Tax=Cyprinodon variegatus TaxID=28743 RepID=UPI000742621E|nr:PREDICTED: zinc finger protein 664-like [Cyprinodon variegatus]
MEDRDHLHPNILEAALKPEVLHLKDVKQMLVVKEEDPVDHLVGAELLDPQPPHTKEEQEEVCISLRRELLNSKEETISFPVSVPPFESVDDDHCPLILQRHQHQVKDKDVLGEESIRVKDDGDCFIASDEVKPCISQLKHLSESRLKPKDVNADWKEGPETGSSPSLDDEDTRLTEKDDEDSRGKVQTGNMFRCKDCGETFPEKGSLSIHKRIHKEEKASCCDVCGKSFTRTHNLNNHMRIHTGEKSFCCDVCGQKFTLKPSLRVHMRIHTGQKPFCCDLCGQKFNQKSALNTHVRIHTGEKPFCCEICGQKYVQLSNLKAHQRTHTGEKPFGCDLCGQRFSHPSTLRAHVNIHSGEKPFCCEICGQRFCQKTQLITHMRTHTGHKPYGCELCGQRFSHKVSLRTHMSIHTGQKPFCCDLCGQGYNQQAGLTTHMTIHAEQEPLCCDMDKDLAANSHEN